MTTEDRLRSYRNGVHGEFFMAVADEIEALRAELNSREWVSVEERLPEHGVNVLVFYVNSCGKKRRVVAEYIPRWSQEASHDDDCHSEYSEEKDEYFIIEGWYEIADNSSDYGSYWIHEGTVTHWQPIPTPPTQKGGE